MQINNPAAVFYNLRTGEFQSVYRYQIIENQPSYYNFNTTTYDGNVVAIITNRWFEADDQALCGQFVTEDGAHKVINDEGEWVLISIGDVSYYTPPEPDENYIEEWLKLIQE